MDHQTKHLILSEQLSKKTMSMDRRTFNEALIYLVQKSPAIWDSTRSDYKHARNIGLLWENIAKNLNTTAKHAAYRWRNLRDTFRKQIRKIEDGNNNGDVKNFPYIRWSYFEQLKFLIRPMTLQMHYDNQAAKPTTSLDETESEDNYELLEESQYSIEGEMPTVEQSMSLEIQNEQFLSFDIKQETFSPSEPTAEEEEVGELSVDGESQNSSVSLEATEFSTFDQRQSSNDFNRCLLQQLQQTTHLLAKNESTMRSVGAHMNKQLDPLEHFLLSLVPDLKDTPPDLLHSLQMHIIYIVSKYRQGIIPTNLPNVL